MAVPPRLRYAILERDGFRCKYCKRSDEALEVDHVIPRSLGGADVPENLVAACRDCNIGKSSAPVGTFVRLPRPQIAVADSSKLNNEAAKWRRQLRDEQSKTHELERRLDVLLRRFIEFFVDRHEGNSERIWLLFDLDDLLDDAGQPDEKKLALEVAPATSDSEFIVEQLIKKSVVEVCADSDKPLADICEKVMSDIGYDSQSIAQAVRKLQ